MDRPITAAEQDIMNRLETGASFNLDPQAVDLMLKGAIRRGGELVSEVARLKAKVDELEAERDGWREPFYKEERRANRCLETLHGIANANYREWDEGLNNLQSFHDWAQSRARHAIKQ